MASIGIDLGTTNSAAAYKDGEQTHIISSGRADGLTPSVIAYLAPPPGSEGEGTILVGQAALDYAPYDPTNAVFSIKRLMGRHHHEDKVIETAKHVSYTITKAAEGSDSGVRVLLGGKGYTPVQISARILRQIKESAQAALGEPVTHAVITVPAYFEERQRVATRRAGEEAGFVVKKIIDEPSAAAVAYGYTVSRGEPRRLFVFDLGGGTFDVSIIVTAKDPRGRNHFEPLKIDGDNWLGGDDFDREIVGEIIAWVKHQYGHDPSDNKVFLLHAKQAAEKAKIALSTATETTVILPVVVTLPNGQPLNIVMSLTRARFDQLIGGYVERAMGIVRQALSSKHLRPDDITNVLMVGGSTLVPLVRDSVARLFGSEKVQQIMNPHHAVALGAGILAATLKGIQCPNESCRHVNDESNERCTNCGESLATAASVGETSVSDVTAVHYGIRALRGDNADAFEVIIPEGTPYPLLTPKTETFYTTAPNFIRVPVFEGKEVSISRNSQQGNIELNEEFFRRKGIEVEVNTPIEVSMNYSRDRILQVKVRVRGTDIEEETTIRHDQPSQPQPEQSEDDNWKAYLQMLIRMCDGFLGKYSGMIREVDRKRLTWEIDKAQEALKADNIQAIKSAVVGLDVALDSCDTASLLFRAEQLKGGIGADRARKLQEVIDEIKERWYQGDRASVDQLERQLKVAVDRLRSREEATIDPSAFKGLLRK